MSKSQAIHYKYDANRYRCTLEPTSPPRQSVPLAAPSYSGGCWWWLNPTQSTPHARLLGPEGLEIDRNLLILAFFCYNTTTINDQAVFRNFEAFF